MTGDRPDFSVIGAGLAGSLMALFLGRAGHRVQVYERRADPRTAGAEGGRSINLAISARGLHALEQVGLRDKVLSGAVPMKGRMIHSPTGELTFQPYGAAGQAINSVSRAGLNLLLLEAAEKQAHLEVKFGHRLGRIDFERATLEFTSPTGSPVSAEAGTIIGTDGAFSAVRGQLQFRDRFSYSQSYLAHGYKELYIPPASGGGFQLEPNALHIWPRGSFMMIALPNQDGSFTCTLFWPFEGKTGFAAIRSEAELLRFFQATYPDAVPLMPTLAHDYFANPTSSLVTVRCSPWHAGEKAVLLGDAAHAIVPFYGQGANAAFEDCVVLDECLRQSPGDRGAAFAAFEQRRKVHADAIADLALANFVEMRDHVASAGFLFKKKVEKILHRLLPHSFVPLYTMISFSRIPYADAVARAARQDRALRWLGGVALALIIVLVLIVMVLP
jgi:kynurenine 3-monooxygenase